MFFLFRCDANSQSGFGHFSRCLNLARSIQENIPQSKLSFYGNFNAFSIQLFNKYNIPFYHTADSNFVEDVSFLDIVSDFIIIDSYLFNQTYVDLVTNSLKNQKLILIDDTCLLNYHNVDLVINFRLNAQVLYNYNSKNTALGLEYFISKPEFKTIRLNNIIQNTPTTIKKVLLFLGGAVNSEVSFELADCIQSIDSSLEITIICSETKSNYNTISPTFEIEKFYSNTDFIINGGGLTKYEGSYCLIPSASLSMNELQYKDSQILSNEGLIFDLGVNDDNLFNRVKAFIPNVLYNQEVLNRMKLSAMHKFYTNSALYLCDRIVKI